MREKESDAPPSSSSHCLEFISRRNKSRQMWFDTKGEVESSSSRRELGFIAWDRADFQNTSVL